jgi:hypothetical protein
MRTLHPQWFAGRPGDAVLDQLVECGLAVKRPALTVKLSQTLN